MKLFVTKIIYERKMTSTWVIEGVLDDFKSPTPQNRPTVAAMLSER